MLVINNISNIVIFAHEITFVFAKSFLKTDRKLPYVQHGKSFFQFCLHSPAVSRPNIVYTVLFITEFYYEVSFYTCTLLYVFLER